MKSKINLVIFVLSACVLLQACADVKAENPGFTPGMLSNQIYIRYDYDTEIVRRYKDRSSIPVSFSVFCGEGYQEEIITCTVESETIGVSFSYSKKDDGAYNNNDAVQMTVSITDSPPPFSPDDLRVHKVIICVGSDDKNIISSESTLYIINSPYGVFLSHVGAESLTDGYYNWLLTHLKISLKTYREYYEK